MTEMFPQTMFDWAETDDRFDLGVCFTLVETTDIEAVLAQFHTVNPRTSRNAVTASSFDGVMQSDGADAHRYSGTAGRWTWVLEELAVSAVLPPLPNRLAAAFRTSVTVQWDVNALSTFVYGRDGLVVRQFELGREPDTQNPEGPEGYVDEESGLDWDRWRSAGLCLQARIAGIVALTGEPIQPAFVEGCSI